MKRAILLVLIAAGLLAGCGEKRQNVVVMMQKIWSGILQERQSRKG